MNFLFASYGDRRANSHSHIAAYANEAAKAGHSCIIGLEIPPEEVRESEIAPAAQLASYASLLEAEVGFSNDRPADLIHAWTPRENVRRFVEAYRGRHPSSALIIHLEDNEEAILESYYQRTMAELTASVGQANEPAWHGRLSHPTEYRRFLSAADAITFLTPSLAYLAPFPKDSLLIYPIVPEKTTGGDLDGTKARKMFGLSSDTKLIVYPGGVSSNNRDDLRALIRATHLLRSWGCPTTVVKTGPSCDLLLKDFEFDPATCFRDLGYVATDVLQPLLSIADALVQPGYNNAFNRDRFPCKIPEFLSSGRPCIVPEMYVSNGLIEADCCLTHLTGAPEEIASLCRNVFENPALSERLAAKAQAFARSRYAPEMNARRLQAFYQSVLRRYRSNPSKRFLSPICSQKAIYQLLAAPTIPDPASKMEAEALEAKNQTLRRELSQWRLNSAQHEQRTARMKATFSWKVTSPLRFLRRSLIDPFTQASAKSTGPAQTEPAMPMPPPIEAVDNPPTNHPCYWKNYHLFCRTDEARIKRYVETYQDQGAAIEERPLISILLPVYNAPEMWLRRCIDSVLAQVYTNWELCIVDDASTTPHVAPTLESYRDPRIALRFRAENGHISVATNDAFALSSGRYIALLDHDDELPPHALARVAEVISTNPQAKILYSDEDKIDENGIRHGPHFKSDWNYDLFLGCNMISHLGVYRRDAFLDVDGFRPGYEGAQDWDLALRISEICQPGEIVHIPEILYHWRSVQGSTAQDLNHKSYAYKAQRLAIESHLKRIGVRATVEPVSDIHWRIRYHLPAPKPSISIVIPTKDRLDLLRPCLESLLGKTEYPNYEVIVVDHQSSEPETLAYFKQLAKEPKLRIVHHVGPFNYSAINNRAIESVESEFVCLLNNDTEIIDGDWLREMASHAARPGIGIVGAKLIFPHQHVQHCGVIMGIGGIAGHAFKFLHREDDGYIHRAQLLSRYSAVTGACMLFRRSLWADLGGFNEQNLAISYNDVDFCLRAGQKGYASLVTPFATLVHKESETRGDSQSPEQIEIFTSEATYMRQKWESVILNDPYYNPNLTRSKEDFGLQIPPRAPLKLNNLRPTLH